MPDPVVNPSPPPSDRKLTGFYMVLGVVVALGLFGVWFWRAYTVWWFDADEAKRRQVAAAAKLSIPVEKSVDLGGGVSLDLVLVPAGRFKMGSPAKERGRGGTEQQHWVVITRPFYIGKYEVTQEIWERVMAANPSVFRGPKNPVEAVSWNNCQEFLQNLNAILKEKGQYRLPTEAEWEWACRAGTRTRFCSGDADDDLADYAWVDADSGSAPHSVGMKKPNAWGLHDMHDNVSEWCGDWYGADYYAKSPKQDPTGPSAGTDRVLRGGVWYSVANVWRSAWREHTEPNDRIGGLGLRVVLPVVR